MDPIELAEFRTSAEALRERRDALLYEAIEEVRAIQARLDRLALDMDDWLSEGAVREVEAAVGQVVGMVDEVDLGVVAELSSLRFPGEPVIIAERPPAEVTLRPISPVSWAEEQTDWPDEQRRRAADHIRVLLQHADERLLAERLAAAERGRHPDAGETELFAAELTATAARWGDCVAHEQVPDLPAPAFAGIGELVRTAMQQGWAEPERRVSGSPGRDVVEHRASALASWAR